MSAKRIGAATLFVIGTLLWTTAVFGVWAQRQALDTDNWVTTSSKLLEDDQIRTALAVALVDRLYDTNAVEQRLRDSLPPRLDPLAAPAATGLREVAMRNAPRILGTTAALRAWELANRGAHAAFLDIVENRAAPNGTVQLDIKGLVARIATSTGLPAGAADRLPPNLARLTIFKSDELSTVQNLVALAKDLVWFLIVGAVAAFAGAIALSRDRRHAVVTVGLCLMIAALLVLALRRVAGVAVVDSIALAPNATAVVDDVWAIATSLLVDAAQGTLLFGAMVASAAWVAGPGRVATAARRVNAPPLRERAALTRAGLAVALLLLVWWGPVPWTQHLIPVLLVTLAAFAWLEWIRRRSSLEFADIRPGELGRELREKGWFARSRPDDTAHASP
jgi:hypothetical protein